MRESVDSLKEKEIGEKGLDSPGKPVIMPRRCEGTMAPEWSPRGNWMSSLTSEDGRGRIPGRLGTSLSRAVPRGFERFLDKPVGVCYNVAPVVGRRLVQDSRGLFLDRLSRMCYTNVSH